MSIPSAPPKLTPPTDDTKALALTIWAEARGEKREGREAVASVVLNRVEFAEAYRRRHGTKYWWGETIAEVCTKAWQFSCWNENDPNRAKLLDGTAERDRAYADCLAIADQAVHSQLPDNTEGATHYLNPKVLAKLPGWADADHATLVIGNHHFFRVV